MIRSYTGAINLLSKKEWYGKFKQNYKKFNTHVSLKSHIEFLIKRNKLRSLIVEAFPWNKTPEGSDFWADVAIEFRSAVEK